MSNLVRSTVAGIIAGTVADIGGGGDAPYSPSQRVVDGDFPSGTNWTIVSAGWVISGGKATSAGTGRMYQALVSGSVLPSGGSIAVSATIQNVNDIVLYIETYKGGALRQVLYQDNVAAGAFAETYIATAEWDTISFRCAGGIDLTLVDVAVTA